MSKKKRRCRKAPPLSAKDRHHICYQGRYWSCGYAKAIRNAFIRPVPIVWHRELHSRLSTVPVHAEIIDTMGVCQAIAWLYAHIPDAEFRKAMQYQLDFFSSKYELGLGAR